MRTTTKKIVQLSSVHVSYDTRIFHKISKSLLEAGYDVDLIIQNEKDEIRDGINICALPIAKFKRDRLFKIFPIVLRKILRYPKKTIVHFHDPELIILGLIFKIFGYKVIYDVHEDVPADISVKDWLPIILRKPIAVIAGWLEQLAVFFFDGIVVVVNDVQLRLNSDHTYLIQNFPIIESENNSKDNAYNKEGNLLYVGDISKIRGAVEMVDAIEEIGPDYGRKFVLAGKFSPPELEEELTNRRGWEYTNFCGWISRDDLTKHLSQSALGLVILYPEPHHIKSQPNKLFEYMYGGIPMVSANLPRYKEIIDEIGCGVTVDPTNLDEIKSGIKYILENPEEAKLMGQRGKRAVIERFNWDQEKKVLFSMYDRLSSSKNYL